MSQEENRREKQSQEARAVSELEGGAERIIEAAAARGLVVRLSGSLAVRKHCPKNRRLQLRNNRVISDIDLVGRFESKEGIEDLMRDLGYAPDPAIATIPGVRRSVFYSPDGRYRCDIFYDVLEFCHTISLRGRLAVDNPTIPLAELLLQKLQIVDLTYKDVLDVQLLLLEHRLGSTDVETINVDLLSALCSSNWGLWYTATENLSKIRKLTLADETLTGDHRSSIIRKIDELVSQLESANKTWGWKLRSLVGTKIRWYNVVEDIDFTFA
jgi:hypothetical protein